MIGRPFQRGQARPAGSGRKKGSVNKPRSVRDHIERRRKQREAALDALYQSDPRRALELDAQMLRDDVQMLRFEEGAGPQGTGTPEAQIQAEARRRGPPTEEEARDAYLYMVRKDASDETRIALARLALDQRARDAGSIAGRFALGLSALLHDYRALREAIAEGHIRGEITVEELLKALAPAPQPREPERAPTEPGGFESRDRHSGIPLGGGVAYLERRPEAPATRHREPPGPHRIVDAEPEPPAQQPMRSRPTLGILADPRAQIGPMDFDSEDRQSVDWDGDVPIIGFGNRR